MNRRAHAACGRVRDSRASALRRWPVLEALEDRVVPSTASSITSNFNGTAIRANDYVWFSSVAKVQGVGSAPVTLRVENQTISFTANGAPYTLDVPDSVLTLTPGATSATTSYDAGAGSWRTSVPAGLGGNVFLGGATFQAVAGLPGGIKNVSWHAEFSTDTAGIKVNWQWAASVYSSFSDDVSSLGVKPVDNSVVSVYQNSDHAGTPENFKPFVRGGARGGGGSNFTGSYSGTATVVPGVVAGNASLSGYVYLDFNNDGVRDPGEFGIQGVVVRLIGVDGAGNTFTIDATTDASGLYAFTGLRAGSYTISRPHPSLYVDGQTTVGTVDGSTNGVIDDGQDITQIVLAPDDDGVEYDFAELFAGS